MLITIRRILEFLILGWLQETPIDFVVFAMVLMIYFENILKLEK